MDTPVIKSKRGLSPIWILPILALALGAWLIYKDFSESGFVISVQINDATGLTAGKTKVVYKGLPVGTLVDFSITPDLKQIIARIEMVKEARDKLTENTKFWVVRPEVSINRITGLETLVRGSYFEVQPGSGNRFATSFKALSDPPALSDGAPGLHLQLISDHAASLNAGSPVLFKKVQVGEIISNNLQKDSSVLTKILIYPKYVDHVSSSSIFFVSSGIELDANLPNFHLRIDPVKTIFQGGVSFFTPPGGQKLENSDNKEIILYRDYKSAQNADKYVIDLTSSVESGLSDNTEIRYNGIKVGSIGNLELSDDLKSVSAKAYFDQNMKSLLQEGTYIYTVKAQVNSGAIANLETLVFGTYLRLIPGKGKQKKKFTVHDQRPVNIPVSTGLNLVLETERLGSLGNDKPVYYRQVQVGHTTGYELSTTGQNVLIYINIYDQYVNLIRENTKFWNSSGLHIKGGLMTSMKISTESMASLIGGGISFSTPDDKKMGNMISNGHHFTLHAEPDDDWLNWSPALETGETPEAITPPAKTKEKAGN